MPIRDLCTVGEQLRPESARCLSPTRLARCSHSGVTPLARCSRCEVGSRSSDSPWRPPVGPHAGIRQTRCCHCTKLTRCSCRTQGKRTTGWGSSTCSSPKPHRMGGRGMTAFGRSMDPPRRGFHSEHAYSTTRRGTPTMHTTEPNSIFGCITHNSTRCGTWADVVKTRSKRSGDPISSRNLVGKSNPFAVAKEMTKQSNRKRFSNNTNSKPLRFGLWNSNSISSNTAKVDFAKKFLEGNSFLALTELTHDASKLVHLLQNHGDLPIITDPLNCRVGLCVPKFFRGCVEIIDSWQHCERRKQKSQIACQITTYKIKLSTAAIVLSVVYLVPDASEQCAKAMCTKMLRLNDSNRLYAAVGDFNIDQKLQKNRTFFKDQVGGFLHQVVKKVTRRATRKYNNRTEISETIIDLMFLSPDLKSRLHGTPEICEDTPSDHSMVTAVFDLKVP